MITTTASPLLHRRTAEGRTGADSLIAARNQIVRKRQTDDDTEELLCKL